MDAGYPSNEPAPRDGDAECWTPRHGPASETRKTFRAGQNFGNCVHHIAASGDPCNWEYVDGRNAGAG